jgi:hypothetical protein
VPRVRDERPGMHRRRNVSSLRYPDGAVIGPWWLACLAVRHSQECGTGEPC